MVADVVEAAEQLVRAGDGDEVRGGERLVLAVVGRLLLVGAGTSLRGMVAER